MQSAKLQELNSLLAGSSRQAADDQRTAYDAIAGPCGGEVVLLGAGQLGARVLDVLRRHGVEPLAFTDNNPALWGQIRNGITILSPAEAARRFGRFAVFVVCVWHPSQTSGISLLTQQFSRLGCKRLAPFVLLFWKYADTCLPYYLWDLPSRLLQEREQVLAAFDLFSDEDSRAEYVSQVRLRLTGDFNCIRPPRREPQYFATDLITRIPDECFVDCGAFDGDSIGDFEEFSGGQYRKIIAFEPDCTNFALLQAAMASRERVQCHKLAVAGEVGCVNFETGGASANISERGGAAVPTTALDVALAAESPTFVKMDIEGAEPEALKGARDVIARQQPVLAICAYHRQDHLWRIPAQLRVLAPDSHLFLRPYRYDGLDLVCYAIPPIRAGASW